MSPRSIVTLIIVLLALALAVGICSKCVGYNRAQNWQLVQSLNGNLRIQSDPGLYWKGFASVWTYPQYMDFTYNDVIDEGDKADERIRVTFNDGGTAQVSTFIRIQTPTKEADQIEFHKQVGGNIISIKSSVKSHMINCLKSAAPLMSASEHQSARKAEFSQIVENQLIRGLYEMKQIEKELKDRFDESGNPITVMATEIVLDNSGSPQITQKSPLSEEYHVQVVQFSVTGSDYDPEILKQFAAKKESFLKAEQKKAEREQMVQERLMIQERGLRDKAEAEALANVEKAKAVIAAQQKAEVALQVKKEAETKASQLLEVAKIEKEEAQVQLDKAKLEAQATVELAKAEQEKIRLAGAITEYEQAVIDANVQIMSRFAEYLPQMQVPTTVVSTQGGGEGESGEALTSNMMGMILLRELVGGSFNNMGKIDPDLAGRKILKDAGKANK